MRKNTGINSNLDKIQTKLDKIQTKLDKIQTKLDKFTARGALRGCKQIIDDKDKIKESNPNNASFVSVFDLAGKKLLFPGDLETKGWNEINPCNICASNINYYAVSHHGSINGFNRNVCNQHKSINSVTDCLPNNVNAVLMGRDGAYSGIYSPVVISAFQNLYYSEKDNNGNPKSFLEIDLNTDIPKWY